MNVLVAYASKHGSTVGIAERIGSALTAEGFLTTVKSVEDVDDVTHYDAVVLGSATYSAHWMREASAFAKRHHADLAGRPVWLFSSGPLGDEKTDEEGRDVLEATEPREFEKFADLLAVRGDRVFFGAWNPGSAAVGLQEKVFDYLPRNPRNTMPGGDFRDWKDIDAWARNIAADLRASQG